MIIINNNTGAQKDIDTGALYCTRLKWPYSKGHQKEVNELVIENSDIVVAYASVDVPTNLSLFSPNSFLGKHAKKIIVEGNEIDDVSQVESILNKIFSIYDTTYFSVEFILDTDTVEGDLFGIDYKHSEEKYAFPAHITINTKIKNLHFENLVYINETAGLVRYPSLDLWNSKTEIFENGIITGYIEGIIFPYTLKDIKPNAFGKYVEDGEEHRTTINGEMTFLATVVPQSHEMVDVNIEESASVFFPALLNVEYDYSDYVTDAFGIDKSKMTAEFMFSNERYSIKQE